MLFVDSPVFKMQGGHCCSDVGLYHCKIEVQETMAWINTVETVDVPSLVTLAPQKTRCRGREEAGDLYDLWNETTLYEYWLKEQLFSFHVQKRTFALSEFMILIISLHVFLREIDFQCYGHVPVSDLGTSSCKYIAGCLWAQQLRTSWWLRNQWRISAVVWQGRHRPWVGQAQSPWDAGVVSSLQTNFTWTH